MTKVLVLGAGGAGVSNIAQIYRQQGFNVVGADKIKNIATANLESLGIKVCLDNDLSALENTDLIFKSSAIKNDNLLLIEAKKQGIKIITRHDFFKNLSLTRDVIAVSGSSGKTSVTSVTSHVLSADRDCGYLVGIHGKGGHNGSKEVKEFVLEADEYAKTFLSLEKVNIS